MLAWNQLHQDLESATNRHRQLAAKFEQFAKFVAEQVAAPAFHIKGIGISLNLDQGFFSTTFAGRTLHYTFESVPSENGTLVGKVTCYLKKEFPTLEYISIGDFQFTGSGQTTLVDPMENDPIKIDVDLAALYVVLNYIHESLSR
ncbi:MAG: hypothetical protein WA146_05980 [Thiobacillus sp.]|nr:hypothetical protein [Bellilinea sp.]